MAVRASRRWLLPLILGALILGGVTAAIGGVSADATPNSIARDWEPVIVIGAQLEHLQGTPTDELFVYAYREGDWQQIPFQVDEMASGVYTSTQGSPLDEDDEIVFMASDLGDRPAVEDIAASLPVDPTWYRIEVTDPLSPTARGWAYVVRSASLTQSFTETYAWFDPVTKRITTNCYALGFLPDHPGFDYLALNGSGEDILDRTKIRLHFLGGLVTFDEDDIDAPAPAPVKDGPVRVIVPGRGVVGYQTVFTIWFAEEPESTPTAARLSLDFSADVVPATYYDANTSAGVSIDGEPDDVAETPLSDWRQVSSGTGSLVQVSDASGSGGTATNYYKDNSTADAGDTGDLASYGDMGVRVDGPNEVLLYVTLLYVLPGSEPSVGEQYAAYAFHPLQATAAQGPPCPEPVADVTIEGPDSGTTGVTAAFSATVDPGDATEPIIYTWSEEGLVGGQGTSEASYRWATAGTQVISVTVRNCGGLVSDGHEMVVSEPPSCDHPLTGVSLSGPGGGEPGETLVFTASPEPGEATLPITYTWSADGLVGGQGTSEASYRWASAGEREVAVTARNCGGQDFMDSQPVTIGGPCPAPVAGVTISGPGSGTTGVTVAFSATVDPGDATEPVIYTWSEEGLVGGQGTGEASYRWATAGTHVISVTVQNCGGLVSDGHEVVVIEPPSCDHPLTGVSLSGPSGGEPGETLVFTASPEPGEATLPITYTWSADNLVGGQGTSEASYRWASAGDREVAVTARNCGGQDVSDSLPVEIREHVYLPLVMKQ